MKITRKGAAADHGPKSVALESSKITFSPSEGSFLYKQDDPVRDFSMTGSRHIYRVRVELAEYVRMTKALSKSFKEIDDDAVLSELRGATEHFFRLGSLMAIRG